MDSRPSPTEHHHRSFHERDACADCMATIREARAALPPEPPSDPHPLDDTLRVIGALAHEASRDHEKGGCVVCVAARPILDALEEPTE